MSREPLPPIRFDALADALLAQAETLVPMWLPGGHRAGPEYVCGSLQGGAGRSCSVSLVKGAWSDFSADEQGGDLISLYAAIHGLSMGKAAAQVARDYGLEDVAGVQRDPDHQPVARPPPPPPAAPKARQESEGWSTVRPVPADMPAPTFWHYSRKVEDIEHTAQYRVGDDLHGFVVRFRTSTGDKETLPYTWCQSARDGACKWHWRHWDEPRPLYLPGHQSPEARTVVLVEGERKADILQALLDASAPGVYCVASWPGGANAWAKADWVWLAGCTVLLWPDCDAKREKLTAAERKTCSDKDAQQALQQSKPIMPEAKQPGMKAMQGIGLHLRDVHGCQVQLLPIPAPGAVVDGWDCADAIEVDGWDGERVLAFFGRAQPLVVDADASAPAPAPPPPAAVAGGGGKNDGPANAATDGGDDGGDKPMPWWLEPYWDMDKGRWLTSRKLVIAALQHDEALRDVLGLNELSNNIEARVAWPWPQGKAGPVTSSTDLMLGLYLSKAYGLPSINRAALLEAIDTVANTRPFHPVREWLGGLKHDRKSRIDKWLMHVMGESPDTLSPAVYEYLSLVGRYWLLGMVYRVMEPGCKFDYCPVLEGPGGLGKSTLVEALASSAYFSDTHFDVGRGKEGQEQVQGLWIYEIAELANFGKAEIGLIKAFITAKVDRYRPSYGRVVESYARQCVLVGTTNESTYLRDRTGNRRFWPVPVRHRINIAWIRKWREQLFAEAYALYLQQVEFTPTHEDEARLFVPMQESRLVETAVLSELTHVLTRAPSPTGIGAQVNSLSAFVTMSQLTLALGVDAAKSNPGLEGQIRSWMDHEGWQRVKKQINGARAWGYLRPANWPPVLPDDEDVGDVPNSPAAGPVAPAVGDGEPEENPWGNDDDPF